MFYVIDVPTGYKPIYNLKFKDRDEAQKHALKQHYKGNYYIRAVYEKGDELPKKYKEDYEEEDDSLLLPAFLFLS